MPHPRFVRIRQHFERPRVADIDAAVSSALAGLDLGKRIRPGETVALTAGSRGIAHIADILKAAVAALRKMGAEPFLVPAMGSHGGATADGQARLLASYGVTPEYVGAPIHSSMEVVSLGQTEDGFPLYLDRHASTADHIGVVGRVKPHTGFHGPVESGLLKMMLIGLGKHVGALAYHRILLEEPYDRVVRSVGRAMRQRAPVAFGLAIVENSYDETALIAGIRPEEFEPREEELLRQAREWLPRLPLRQADMVLIDEIGKDISGSGMDTNVVGRKRAFRLQQGGMDQPTYRLIAVRGLSARTHGNATGIGLADFTTTRLVKAMNYKTTVINCLTAGYPEGAFLPVHFDTDREIMEAALKIIGRREPEEARVLWIRNTLTVEELLVSEPCLALLAGQPGWEAVGAAAELEYGADGNLISPFA